MSPAALLDRLRARGVVLEQAPDGRLRVDAPRGALEPGDRVALVDNKAPLLALLAAERGEPAPLEADPYDREERAAILEFDGGLSREEAERLAFS